MAANKPKFDEDDLSDNEEIHETIIDRIVALKVSCRLLCRRTGKAKQFALRTVIWAHEKLFKTVSDLAKCISEPRCAIPTSPLQEFVPESTRNTLSKHADTAYTVGSTGFKWGSNAAWIVTTTVLLLVMPVRAAALIATRVHASQC
jgi:hypothetical protein